MKRLIPYLRLMRLPLVFTAIGNAWAVRFVMGWPAEAIVFGRDLVPGGALPRFTHPAVDLAVLAAISFCLFALGMVLNDVMDVKIDRQRAPHRPIPSGLVPRTRAAVLAVALAVAAYGLAWCYSQLAATVTLITLLLIAGYDLGLKRIPTLGLLLLGLIRAVQCQIPGIGLIGEPPRAMLAGWVSVFLLAHVTMVSWIAYVWEGKRPGVSILGRWSLAFLLAFVTIGMASLLEFNRPAEGLGLLLGGWPILPVAVALAFVVVLMRIGTTRRLTDGPSRGRTAMRLGLMWLLAYDAAFCATAGAWAGVAAMAVLAGLMLLTSRLMRPPTPAAPPSS